ncbi:MAG: D,D-dipeptide ABC transporter permease [Chloroflexi bacterium]|nr:MAG: D,D-dipeptide ABC transporter permease [Chloroflexota bacterium]
MIVWAAPAHRPLLRQPMTLLALAWLGLVALGVLLAPRLAPAGPSIVDPAHVLLPPGQGNPLGTDFLGRDILARLLWGGRWTLRMGALALMAAVGLGLPVGLAAGSLGGRTDAVLMRLVDALLAFPGLLLALAAVAILGTGLTAVAMAVGLAAAPPYARVVRSIALEVRGQPYVEAARAVGCSPWRIAVRHILPNALPSLIAFAATQLGWILLNGAALNFLGLGVPPGTPEWGLMLADGRGYLRDAPWASVFPGLALTLTVLAANLAGDGLQEALQP